MRIAAPGIEPEAWLRWLSSNPVLFWVAYYATKSGMSALVNVAIHSSQFPDAVRRDLLQSLRTRRVNHKFLYDSPKKTQKWLQLHQACSPSRTDDDCLATYDRCFEVAKNEATLHRVHVIGLGCGGGKKDTRLLKALRSFGRELFYTPVDVSTTMVLVARQAALEVASPTNCFPLVCDLASVEDPSSAIREQSLRHSAVLLTFFGMLPNFEPRMILQRLANMLPPNGRLLLSANLAPGNDYAAGVQSVLPLYDNSLTRDWLMIFLQDLGIDSTIGKIRFTIETDPLEAGLRRITAYFDFHSPCELQLDEDEIGFARGDSLRLFFSYRHTPSRVSELLAEFGLQVAKSWITNSSEEGIFLVSHASQGRSDKLTI